jgi:hypothetical protein
LAFQGCELTGRFIKEPILKFYPAVKKVWLQLLAGLIWSGVGIMLVSIASRWFRPLQFFQGFLLLLAGMALAAAIYFFGFSKLALKNVHRILDYQKERVCLFAFQRWTSYPLVLFMVSLGIYLRVYSPIPKPYLAILYVGIGGSLFLASLHYYAQVVRNRSAA